MNFRGIHTIAKLRLLSVDKNRLQCYAFVKPMQKNLAKIANSWLT